MTTTLNTSRSENTMVLSARVSACMYFLVNYYCAFFPSFISNTSIVSINFRANLDAQNAENGISGLQISKSLCGACPHTRGLRPLLSASNK